MNKKILILFLIITLSACGKEKLQDETISKHTENIMLNRDVFINEILNETEEVKEEKESKKEEETIILSNEELSKVEIKNNDNQPENLIHKGRIDCQNIDECLNISTNMQKEFKSIIASSNYLPVKDNNNSILGYFIVYHFKNAYIPSVEECHSLGINIVHKLADRITKYECQNNTLTIMTDYGGHNET